MHLPLLSRVLFLLAQLLILTMALPAAKHAASAPVIDERDLTEREPNPESNAEPAAAPLGRNRFGKRLNIEKPGSPVKAMVRSPDAFPRQKAE